MSLIGILQVSMGLESDITASSTAFVDTYGSAFGRDVEPTQARTINKPAPPFFVHAHAPFRPNIVILSIFLRLGLAAEKGELNTIIGIL